MRTCGRSRRSCARSSRRGPNRSLPFHSVLAVVGTDPHALRLRDLALHAAIDEPALVDPMEHRAHRRRGHPVVVPEHDLAALRRDLEPAVVPFLRVDDWRALGECRQRDRLGQLLAHGREGAHRLREELPNGSIAAVPKFVSTISSRAAHASTESHVSSVSLSASTDHEAIASATTPRPRLFRKYSRNRTTLEPRIFGTKPSFVASRTVGVT